MICIFEEKYEKLNTKAPKKTHDSTTTTTTTTITAEKKSKPRKSKKCYSYKSVYENDYNAVNHASASVDRKTRARCFFTLIVFCWCGVFCIVMIIIFRLCYPRQRKATPSVCYHSHFFFCSLRSNTTDYKLLFKNLLFILSFFYVSYCFFPLLLFRLLFAV